MSAVSTQTKPAITKEIIMPGPALLAATAVSTKMPVPMTAPMPSMVSSNQPSWRFKPFFSAAARIMSSDLVRKFIATPEGFLMAGSWDSYVQKAIEDAANREAQPPSLSSRLFRRVSMSRRRRIFTISTPTENAIAKYR